MIPNRLSIPSAVLAEASWYGSIRAGWTSESGSKAAPTGAGVKQFGSRWGIKGASEVSDGLSAVYKFETRIGEGAQSTAQIYAGLSGGFGTVSMGKMFTAGDNHVGFVDNSTFLGSEAGLIDAFAGSTVSYASPSIGGFSFQVDAQGDQSGAQDKDVDSAQFGATLQLGENGKIGMAYIDRATKGADNPVAKRAAGFYRTKAAALPNEITAGTSPDPGSSAGDKCPSTASDCAFSAAVAADATAHIDDDRTAMIAGQYKLGGMALHLGYGQRKWDTDSKAGAWQAEVAGRGDNRRYGAYDGGLAGGDLLDKKQKTTFFGVAGGIGDTGVGFFLQVKDTKTDSNKVTHSYQDKFDAWDATATEKAAAVTDPDKREAAEAAGIVFGDDGIAKQPGEAEGSDGNYVTAGGDFEADRARGSEKSSEKNTPFVIGLSRSLGGGASIHLEHDNKDSDTSHNVTALFLKVDF